MLWATLHSSEAVNVREQQCCGQHYTAVKLSMYCTSVQLVTLSAKQPTQQIVKRLHDDNNEVTAVRKVQTAAQFQGIMSAAVIGK
jgi:hypothetical protein